MTLLAAKKLGILLLILLATMMSTGCSTFSSGIDQQLIQLDIEYKQSPELARTQLKELKDDHADDARPWIKSGYWSLKEQDIERAGIAFRQARRLDNNNVEIYMGLGICADSQKRHIQAQEYYKQGLKLESYNLKLKNNLALSYLLSQEIERAISLLESTINDLSNTSPLTPSEKDRLRANLSLAYAMNNNPQQAYNIDKQLLGEPTAQRNRLAAEAMSSGKTQ